MLVINLRDRIAFAPEGDDGGGEGRPPPSSPPPDPNQAPVWASTLISEIQKLNKLAESAQQRQPTPTPTHEEEEDEDPPIDPNSLETMSRADLSNHIVNQVVKTINKQVVAPLNQRIDQLSAQATRSDVRAAVEEAASSNKDFWEWRSEMQELVQQPAYRSLSPLDLYQLARSKNPDKTRQVDEKLNPRPPSNQRIFLKAFGGLTPSQTGTGSKSQKMNGAEAADAAWQETVKALGGEPMFEE